MRALVIILLTALMGASVLGQVSVVPTEVQLPGTQPGEVSNLQDPTKCDNCHGGYDLAVEPAHNWRGSMMAQASRDPVFWATVAVAEQDFPGAGDLCIRCHTPDGWLGGRSTPTDGSGLASSDADGVTCDACHRITNPDTSEWLGVQNAPFLAHDEGMPPEGYHGSGMLVVFPDSNTKLGPYDDAEPNHGFHQSLYHRSADFCGTCHDVSNPVVGDLAASHGAQLPLDPGSYSGVPGAPVDQKAAFNNPPYAYGIVERTFSEHQASAFAGLTMADYAGLPTELQQGSIRAARDAAFAATPDGNYVDGAVRSFTCQTCHMRPVTGAGCDKQSAPIRSDLPLHDMTGGGSWQAEVIAYLDGQGDLLMGGGLGQDQLDALDDGGSRAIGMLQGAAALEVSGDVVKVINLTGHKLLSGYPEGRRMWLRVAWEDDLGSILREDGAYGPLAVTLDGQPLDVDTILDLDDPHLQIYEAHPAMSQEWAAALIGLGYSPAHTLAYDRLDGSVTLTLGDLANQAPGTYAETFHFALNDRLVSDNRIPPYGMAYDEARTRNCLPVPETRFGDPGPGGVYDHFDLVTLAPPPGAVSASIDLLYQPTSWEYIQFLALANDGSVAFLADEGEHLLEGWLATGMATPVVMDTATWAGAPNPWVDLGQALAGTHGVPSLTGEGSLVGGTPTLLTVTGGLPLTSSWMILGLSELGAPFKGGTLVPNPDVVLGGLPLDGAGSVSLPFTWPEGLPGNATSYWQVWFQDTGGPFGWAATNAVAGTTP